jgi:hypothetical protein
VLVNVSVLIWVSGTCAAAVPAARTAVSPTSVSRYFDSNFLIRVARVNNGILLGHGEFVRSFSNAKTFGQHKKHTDHHAEADEELAAERHWPGAGGNYSPSGKAGQRERICIPGRLERLADASLLQNKLVAATCS